jgi:putative addiction module component (TIGR02574 family)
MTTPAIRQKLYDYIRVAEDKKVKAIYTMLEEEIEENYDHWKDKAFVAELNRRAADYKSGKVKGISWEDAKASITGLAKRRAK